MYAETGLMLPYSHNLPQLQQFDEVYFQENLHSPSEIPGSLAQTSSAMPDYYLGEGDLFKAPEPILEEPFMDLDPMTSSISMVSFGGDVLSPQTSLAIPEIESSFESGQLLSDVFYECKKDLLAKVGNETPLSEVVSIKSSVIKSDEISVADQKFLGEDEATPIQKSVSFSCLRSMDVGPEALLRPKFIDFSVLDFGAVNVMRRAYSDGDIKNLGNGSNISSIQQTPTTMLPQIPSFTWEDRKEKLSRYRQKKSKRNFGRKIKYACRKALADSQPRIRGRFAKTEDVVEVSMKKQ